MIQHSFDFGPGWPPAADPTPATTPAQWTPPDQPARDRINADLETNLLVEAGAGSGKTTSMVGRMIALVRAGREVERIAAVTFTRKAAAELRERFQEALESAYREAVDRGDVDAVAGFGAALDAIDRCFLGTIHAFCARLLRERPLEAGVPPDFSEVSETEEDRLRAESWARFLERLSAGEGSRLMRAMAEHGLRPVQLHSAFREIADNPDVRFPAPPAPAPDPADVAAVRRRLERLMDVSESLMPDDDAHPLGPGKLQTKIRRLRFRRWILRWDRDVDFMEALDEAVQGSNDVTQNRWGSDRETRAAAKALGQQWEEFCAEDGQARRLIETWWARRYRVAMRFARAAAGSYAADRVQLGRLTFQDLLVRTTALLRSHPGARAELGERYRWLLVDEFQDTDPVQAEMLLLLTSDPDLDPPPDAAAPLWLRVAPRPGALFVVGDPKQSIYRFRRADIAVYNQVKQRFRQFGDMLHLVTNFRSRRPIEAFVNRVFAGRFPADETEHQAAYAPLRVRPDRSVPSEGVYWYRFEAGRGQGGFSGPRIAGAECRPLASWIRSRIDRGERRPGDFMVLTTRKAELATYARALEAQGVPVQVTGAGVGADLELTELILLLRALADPDDAVLTLAVLEGLFFGLSHEDLYAHVRDGGRFSFTTTATGAAPGGPVDSALASLHSFWNVARRLPADIAVATIVDRLGILPWAAAGELGSTRAGAVVYAMDALRAAARHGAASLAEAIEILEAALDEEVDAPLVPGETDAVRVMNLHRAKGLEAPVVVLAYPARLPDPAIHRHVARVGGGDTVGWLRILDPTQRPTRIVGRPADWPAHEAAEKPFQDGEMVRQLYVAATRAAEELVVARCDQTGDRSCWAGLHEALDAADLATEIRITVRTPPDREVLHEPARTIDRRILQAADRRERLAEPSYRAMPVTARVHGTGPGAVIQDGPDDTGAAATPGLDLPRCEILFLAGPEFRPVDRPPPEPRGREWGSAVHRALEAMARGAGAELLPAICRAALVEFDRPVDPATGEPVELDELRTLVEAVGQHAVWDRVRAARRVLAEVPFSFAVGADEARRLGIAEPADVEILDGTIDLALQDHDGHWTIIDFKTDAERDPERERLYARQLRLYALAWGAGPAAGVADRPGSSRLRPAT